MTYWGGCFKGWQPSSAVLLALDTAWFFCNRVSSHKHIAIIGNVSYYDGLDVLFVALDVVKLHSMLECGLSLCRYLPFQAFHAIFECVYMTTSHSLVQRWPSNPFLQTSSWVLSCCSMATLLPELAAPVKDLMRVGMQAAITWQLRVPSIIVQVTSFINVGC